MFNKSGGKEILLRDGETQSYSFDAMGNRTQLSDTVTPTKGSATTTTTQYTSDNANRLTGVSVNGSAPTPVTFDADGNTLTDSAGRTFTWDTENRMISCTLPNNGGTTTFTYGADGLRRSKTRNGITTNFVYDNSMLVEEMQYNASAGAR